MFLTALIAATFVVELLGWKDRGSRSRSKLLFFDRNLVFFLFRH